MVDRKTADKVLRTYEDAWVKQDPDKILTIFTKDAVYHERAFEKPFVGHGQIRRYWQSKVVEEQSDIKFKLLHSWIDGNTVLAEWDASFYSKAENSRIHIKEVAILEFRGDKIKSLREYWHSERP
ncbi:MAG: nuclear transport factor 2 family protein [Candidatus Aenigmatarchaeota archaeon]